MADCQYPPFIRNGLLYTPYWKNYKVGDVAYDVSNDQFMECIRPCVRLEADIAESIEPPEGKSPLELGYAPADYWSLDNWERRNLSAKELLKAANG